MMIMINNDNHQHNHQDNHNNNDNDQAANPTTVNVPLCLDLTLNWLLNVYDWSAYNNDDDDLHLSDDADLRLDGECLHEWE